MHEYVSIQVPKYLMGYNETKVVYMPSLHTSEFVPSLRGRPRWPRHCNSFRWRPFLSVAQTSRIPDRQPNKVDYLDLVMVHHRAADASEWPRQVSAMKAFPDNWSGCSG